MKIVLLLALSILPAIAAPATLSWEPTVKETSTIPMDGEIVETFKFTNTGSDPFTIVQALPSCACTTASFINKTYFPGDTGELKVKMDLREKWGVTSVTIPLSVLSMDTMRQVDGPRFTVTIAPRATISPRVLIWSKGETGNRFVTIRLSRPERDTLVRLDTTGDEFAVIGTKKTEPGVYQVEIAQPKMESAAKATFKLILNTPASEDPSFFAFVR